MPDRGDARSLNQPRVDGIRCRARIGPWAPALRPTSSRKSTGYKPRSKAPRRRRRSRWQAVRRRLQVMARGRRRRSAPSCAANSQLYENVWLWRRIGTKVRRRCVRSSRPCCPSPGRFRPMRITGAQRSKTRSSNASGGEPPHCASRRDRLPSASSLRERRDALQSTILQTAARMAQQNRGECRRTLPVFTLGEGLDRLLGIGLASQEMVSLRELLARDAQPLA